MMPPAPPGPADVVRRLYAVPAEDRANYAQLVVISLAGRDPQGCLDAMDRVDAVVEEPEP